MRVFITGAAGFIGSHLAHFLLAKGHDVAGVDNLLTGRLENFPTQHSGALFVELDITNREELYSYANYFKPDLVIHCAASYSDPDKWHRDTDTNVAGCINAALVAKHHKASLIYFQTALPPISSYAISKIAGEQYITLSGVPSLIFRLSNIYGPRNLSGPIPTFYKRLTAGQSCTVTDTKRDMVYIGDLVNLVLDAIDRGTSGKYDVCSGRALEILELYDAVAYHVGSSGEPRLVDATVDDVKQMDLNPSKALTDFNWRPRTSLGDGVFEAVMWYEKNGVGETYTHLSLKG